MNRTTIVIRCRWMWRAKIIAQSDASGATARLKTDCRFGFQAISCSKARH